MIIGYALNLPQNFCQTQLYKSLHHESFAAFPDSMGRRLSHESLHFHAFKSLFYNCHMPIGLQCRSAHQLTLTHLLNKCNRVTITLSPSSCFSWWNTNQENNLEEANADILWIYDQDETAFKDSGFFYWLCLNASNHIMSPSNGRKERQKIHYSICRRQGGFCSRWGFVQGFQK